MTKRANGSQAVDLTRINGWNDLGEDVRTQIESRIASVRESLRIERESHLGIGQELFEIRRVLLPLKMWIEFLAVGFGWSQRTAYRYIADYELAAKSNVPENVLKIAIQRGSKAISRPELVKRMPPPKTDDTQKIVAYLEKLEESKPKSLELVKEPTVQDRLKTCIHLVSSHYDKIKDKRQKITFAQSLIGMELTRFGYASDSTFSPIAIPENFRTVRGRPAKDKPAA
jgi:hypothetical protein